MCCLTYLFIFRSLLNRWIRLSECMFGFPTHLGYIQIISLIQERWKCFFFIWFSLIGSESQNFLHATFSQEYPVVPGSPLPPFIVIRFRTGFNAKDSDSSGGGCFSIGCCFEYFSVSFFCFTFYESLFACICLLLASFWMFFLFMCLLRIHVPICMHSLLIVSSNWIVSGDKPIERFETFARDEDCEISSNANRVLSEDLQECSICIGTLVDVIPLSSAVGLPLSGWSFVHFALNFVSRCVHIFTSQFG